jgi:starch phosphorylase
MTDLRLAAGIERFAGDPAFQQEFLAIKRQNKLKLLKVVLQSTGISIDPDSMFDVQVKRIHEYKRQLLNVMRVIHEYLSVVEDQAELRVPRTYIFAGKSAPGYWAAKQTIKLIHNVAAVVNGDPRVKGRMKVIFVPDYRVSLAETIIPAADLSQQISTAGMEASGTGNMKLAMNGALTLGTLDGANIEIMEAVGKPNIYIFGLTPEEVRWYREQRTYSPRALYESNPQLHRVIDSLSADRFSADEQTLFRWIVDEMLDRGDRYFHLADLPGYIEASRQAERDYETPAVWTQKAILNVARVGYFSSDRAIKEYADEIWGIRSAVEKKTDHPITGSHPILAAGHPVLD